MSSTVIKIRKQLAAEHKRLGNVLKKIIRLEKMHGSRGKGKKRRKGPSSR